MIYFQVVREWINFFADMCILAITIYTSFVTFVSKKMIFQSIGIKQSRSEGDSISVVLENKTLSPIVVDKVNLIVDNKYKVSIKNYDSPLIIEPFTAKKVSSDRFSYMEPDIGNMVIGKNNRVLEVYISGGKKYLPLHKKRCKLNKQIKQCNVNVTLIASTYNGKIIPRSAKYALVVSKEHWDDTIFIFESGTMTGEILGYNALPKEVVRNEGSLNEFLREWLEPNNIDYHLEELENSFPKSVRVSE